MPRDAKAASDCPKCHHKLAKFDGKKLPGGTVGNKYWTCIPCGYVRPVKHKSSR